MIVVGSVLTGTNGFYSLNEDSKYHFISIFYNTISHLFLYLLTLQRYIYIYILLLETLFLMLGRPISATESLPSGFDLGLRGMSVGERRRFLLPHSLAYDSVKKFPLESGQLVTVAKGQPLVIEVKLLSLNGLTTP
jgi:hypothetical protein